MNTFLLHLICLILADVTSWTTAAIIMSPPIMTKAGPIRGQLIEMSPTLQVYQFIGIPFADPPIGDLRFKKPTSKTPWTKLFDAVKKPNACIQATNMFGGNNNNSAVNLSDVVYSEDCLFLNLWVPKRAIDQRQGNNKTLFSVMTFIHGGGFAAGGTMYDLLNGTVLSGYNNIIVASIQYRLGSFGFLFFANEDAPGNMGLWDQVEAMKWIGENIGSFGGNGSDVTIFGQSGGAASVAIHLLSPQSRRFFKKAIIQSGSALSPWSARSRAESLKRANILFETINKTSCNIAGFSSEKLKCLRSLNANLFPSVETIFPGMGLGLPFIPVIDGDFLPKDPLEMLKSGDFYNAPLMFGFNKNEGTGALMTVAADLLLNNDSLTPKESVEHVKMKDWKKLLNATFAFSSDAPQMRIPALMDSIGTHYLLSSSSSSAPTGADIVKAAADAGGDYTLACPTANWASQVAKSINSSNQIKMFGYYFTHRSPGSQMPTWLGTMHGDKVPYVFGQPLSSSGKFAFLCGDTALSRVMMAYWTNFAKFGDPNVNDEKTEVLRLPDGPIYLPYWQAFNGDKNCSSGVYFEINSDKQVYDLLNPATVCQLKTDDCNYWLNGVPALAKLYYMPN